MGRSSPRPSARIRNSPSTRSLHGSRTALPARSARALIRQRPLIGLAIVHQLAMGEPFQPEEPDMRVNTLRYTPNELSHAAVIASRQMWLAGLGAAVVSRDWIQ